MGGRARTPPPPPPTVLAPPPPRPPISTPPPPPPPSGRAPASTASSGAAMSRLAATRTAVFSRDRPAGADGGRRLGSCSALQCNRATFDADIATTRKIAPPDN